MTSDGSAADQIVLHTTDKHKVYKGLLRLLVRCFPMNRYLLIGAITLGSINFRGGFVQEDIAVPLKPKVAADLYQLSLPLIEERSLYGLGAGVVSNDPTRQLKSDEDRKAVIAIYNSIMSRQDLGNWNNDAIDYNSAQRSGSTWLPKGHRLVRWVKRPSLRYSGNSWSIDLTHDSEEHVIDLPPSGFGIPTADGLYRPETGTPFATVPSYGIARKLLEQAGFDPDLETTYLKRFNRLGGVTIAARRSSRSDGLFVIDITNYPHTVDRDLGYRSIFPLAPLK